MRKLIRWFFRIVLGMLLIVVVFFRLFSAHQQTRSGAVERTSQSCKNWLVLFHYKKRAQSSFHVLAIWLESLVMFPTTSFGDADDGCACWQAILGFSFLI